MVLEPAILIKLQGVFGRYSEIAAVYLFGSRATGTARPDSDYDLAVVSNRGRQARGRKLDILADLARNGFDDIDLTFLDHDNMVLQHEAVRLNQLVFRRPEFDHGSFYSRVVRMYFDILPHLAIQRQALKERILHGAA
jgi:predicted nucleotidyltransferase